MKLAQWRQEQSLTQSALADALGCSQAFVSGLERPQPVLPRTPYAHDFFARLYRLTRGAVMPNDFFDLPDLDTLALPLEPVDGAAPLLEGAR